MPANFHLEFRYSFSAMLLSIQQVLLFIFFPHEKKNLPWCFFSHLQNSAKKLQKVGFFSATVLHYFFFFIRSILYSELSTSTYLTNYQRAKMLTKGEILFANVFYRELSPRVIQFFFKTKIPRFTRSVRTLSRYYLYSEFIFNFRLSLYCEKRLY